MEISAFILVEVRGDHTKSAFKTITRIEGVKAVYAVTGSYDIIVLVEADSVQNLSDKVLSKIRSVDGVIKTSTSIVLNLSPSPVPPSGT